MHVMGKYRTNAGHIIYTRRVHSAFFYIMKKMCLRIVYPDSFLCGGIMVKKNSMNKGFSLPETYLNTYELIVSVRYV